MPAEPPPAPAPPPGNLYQAKPYDSTGPDGRPVVDRPAVPEELRGPLVRYLESAPVVLAAHSLAPDLLSADGRAAVPLTFHTDGTWTWQGSVAYYLKTYGLPPEPALVAHVRAAGFRLPVVSEEAEQIALRISTGQQDAAPHPSPVPPAPAAPAYPYPSADPAFAPGMPPPAGMPPGVVPPGAVPPGAMPPTGTPANGYPPPNNNAGKRAAISVISVVAAIAVLLGGKAISGAVRKEMRGGSSSSSSDTGITVPDAPAGGPSTSTSASAPPTPAAPAVVTKLPDYCKGLRASLPAKVRGIKVDTVTSDSDRRSCQWERLTSSNGRNLDVVVDTNVIGGPEDAVEEAREAFVQGWEHAADPEFRKGREKLRGLGDEAFASHQVSPIVYGTSEATVKTYWLGGAEVFVRKGNVTIEVTWTAADGYRTSGKLVQGTNLPYKTAKKQAIEMATKILATLE
ncbi:hypothetical protein [Actinomadura algeriensis]|uniref:DUF3558 domain-containing protein n=1 Tax=Actinomadura algeriensis TaxID=1679523 RepID=A0ABR9JSC0_9ACTN|nr:hypothetical protein [Actinomadura algeriensis]MBE1533383.1 hypothetical protein [Actinomadura algeriensis]